MWLLIDLTNVKWVRDSQINYLKSKLNCNIRSFKNQFTNNLD